MKATTITASLLLLVMPTLVRADAQTDRKIEAAAKASYNYRVILEDSIKVKSTDGVVTLAGTVPESDHRALAEDTVLNLPGVTKVDNQIKVAPPAPEHSDGWIATKLRTKLLLKSNVSAADTKVEVKDGNVTLTGTAEGLAQKELTGAYAREIEGVKTVNNQLALPAPVNDSRTMADRMDDASITAQVKYALFTHKSTSAMKTSVSTSNGMVTIEGEAESPAEKDLVTLLAEKVRGVKAVSNTMAVKG